ncbi:MAG: hypothetical protein U9O83_02300, partial [Campylobacterota bacterium]|nr:hypothetical protein [Campylobacterota bacterium]
MRNSLGRMILTFFSILHLEIYASTYEWSAEADKSVAMTNEAIYLKYICEFSDRAELYNIEFNPVADNERYTIILLSEKVKIVDGRKINSFEFVAFVKESGMQEFVFDTIMKQTNKDSIENTVLGRDNADYEEFSQKIIRQNAINIYVKKSGSDLVGEFELGVKKDEKKVKAYEPYQLEILIDGVGNFNALKPIEFKISGVKVFAQKPIKDIKLTKDGYRGSWSQKFAFVGESDFKIPKKSIKYFDLKDETLKEFIVGGSEVEVIPAYKKEELLDAKEDSSEFNYDIFYYILTYIAGFLVAKLKFKRAKKTETADATFRAKIKNAKSLEELMIILVLKDSKKYGELILKIEKKEM